MPGFFLAFALVLLFSLWVRKNKSIKVNNIHRFSIIILCTFALVLNLNLLIFTGYNFQIVKINRETLSYQVIKWGKNKNDSFQSTQQDSTNSQPSVNILDNNSNTNNISQRIGSYFSDVIFEKIIAWIILAMLCILTLILYKIDFIKKYQAALKENLFNIHHKWLIHKSLEDVLISVKVRRDKHFQTAEIYKYFDEYFNKNDYGFFVILGNAGEGKTVSIRYLSNELLKKIPTRSRKFKLFKNRTHPALTPVILEFSDLKYIHSSNDLLNFIVGHIQREITGIKWFYEIKIIKKNIAKQIISGLKGGEFILFIDGYDEVDEETRCELSKILANFSHNHPLCFIIITSRTAVYNSKEYLHIDDNRVVWLSPLNKEQIIEFLSKWNFDDDKNQWEIYEKIIYNYQLERLAQNPLLLTLILYLYDKSKLIIPNTINEFYTNSMKCLLEDWESQKNIFNRNTVNYEIKICALQNIAYTFFQNKEVPLKYTDIIYSINQIANQYGELPKTIFREIYEYSGIIEKTEKGYYKFYHRSFYEYFLASYLLNNSVSILSFTKDSSRYYNVIFFYFSMSSDQILLNKYIEDNFNNDAIVQPLLLDCSINNQQLIIKYVQKKLDLKHPNESSYYQFLGNIAER